MIYDFHPAAKAEFLESVGYYESKVPGFQGWVETSSRNSKLCQS